MLAFEHVSFSYPGGSEVLRDATFALERGKTYALVGPTGGGKTTTASLMARLYDPTGGRVLLDGRDIRTYHAGGARAGKIGFILQEPFLFTGTIRDNIVYGNDALPAAIRTTQIVGAADGEEPRRPAGAIRAGARDQGDRRRRRRSAWGRSSSSRSCARCCGIRRS